MIPYYVVYFTLIIAASYLESTGLEQRKKDKDFCVIAFFLVFAILALRSQNMGIDLSERGEKIGYLGSFDKLNNLSWHQIIRLKSFLNYERGYIIFNKFVGTIYNNKQFFLAVCAGISVFPVIWYIYRNSQVPLISVIIFLGMPVFMIFFSGVRQAIAIGITIFSMKFVEEKKLIKFIITVWFASLFHYSAILFLIAYPIYYLKLKPSRELLYVLLIPGVYILRVPLFTVLSKLLKDSAEVSTTGAFTLFAVFCAIYIFLLTYNDNTDEKQNGMINMFYIACICQAFGGVHQLALRVGYYFMVYAMIAIPNTLAEIKDLTSRRTVHTIIFSVFVVYGLYMLANSTWAMTNPYIFFWNR